MFKRSIPVLHVSNAAAAEDFYCGRLGFRQTFAYRADDSMPDPCYQGFEREGVSLHASSFPGDAIVGGVAYIVVESVDRLHEELKRQGVAISLPPTNQTWGNRELYVKDCDGNCLRFVSEIMT